MKKRSRPDKYASNIHLVEKIQRLGTAIARERERTTDEATSERLKNAGAHLQETLIEVFLCHPDARMTPCYPAPPLAQ